MAFCQACGTNLNNAKFCAGCGAPAPQAEPAMAPPAAEAPQFAPDTLAPQPAMAAAPIQDQAAVAYQQPAPAHAQPATVYQPQQAPGYPPPNPAMQQPPAGYAQPIPPYQGQPAQGYPPSPQQHSQPAPMYQQQPAPQQYPQQQGVAQINLTDSQMKKGMAILSYFSYLVLIPIFAAKDDEFARYHANQGLVLTIVLTILVVISNVAVTVLSPISAMLALIVTGVVSLFILVVGIFHIIGIINAAKGRMKAVPIFGGITLLK